MATSAAPQQDPRDITVATTLDVDVVAVEHDEEVSVLLELTAPAAPPATRPPAALVVVLDRSGSMGGSRLEGAVRALHDLVRAMDPRDVLGVVTFDDTATVVVPAGPLTDKRAVLAAVDRIRPGGSTDLSAGYLRGLQELRQVATASGTSTSRLLLVSDGHANRGVTDPARMLQVAEQAHRTGVTTTTLGFGLGYDETLLGAIARGGNGAELFAEDADTAVGLIAAEVEGMLGEVAQAASLVLTMAPEVRGVRVHNDLPVLAVGDGVMVELGAFLAGETRKLVLTFDVPGRAALGLAVIAVLALRYVVLPDLVERTVTWPLHVGVVPGDQAAGRVPDPVVRSELAYLRAQRDKREASRLYASGDVAGAAAVLGTSRSALAGAAAAMPAPEAARLDEEVRLLDELAAEAEFGEVSRASKRLSSDSAAKSRYSGRQPRPRTPRAGAA